MNVPGTVIQNDGNGGMFSVFQPMLQATGGLSLNQVCSITGLGMSTIRNWINRGFVANPIQKKYQARQLARILLISALRDCMKIDDVGELMELVNGNTEDESDDIISENQLYDFFCEATRLLEDNLPTPEQLALLIRNVTAVYDAPSPEARERLTLAMTVMLNAHLSARLKQQAEESLQRIRALKSVPTGK